MTRRWHSPRDEARRACRARGRAPGARRRGGVRRRRHRGRAGRRRVPGHRGAGVRRPPRQRLRGGGPDDRGRGGHRARAGEGACGPAGRPRSSRRSSPLPRRRSRRRAARHAGVAAPGRGSSAPTSRARSCPPSGSGPTPRGSAATPTALLGRLLDAGRVSQVTLAPELGGALELVDALVARRDHGPAGHSAATDEARAAPSAAGRARSPTCTTRWPGTPREPGLATPRRRAPDVVVQVIVDGHHVAADTVRVAWRAAPGRFALVTDAVPAAGAGDGEHRFAGRMVYARCRRRSATPRGRLAGSALTMIQAVRNLHGPGRPARGRARRRGGRTGGRRRA